MSETQNPATGYAVVHEWPHPAGYLPPDFASSPYPGSDVAAVSALESAQNQLAYCQAMQKAGHRGTEGRYFIVAWTEVDSHE